jgi:hypothetical protein
MHMQEKSQVANAQLQNTSHILMVRPVRFGFNEQTAESNAFQQNDGRLSPEAIQNHALQEFDTMVALLRQKGIEVTVFEDTAVPHTPDSIFPNNWISFHQNGTVIIYPMESPSRQNEVRLDIPAHIMLQKGTDAHIIDLRKEAQTGEYLEGTGSMIMDRENQIVYACLSPRTHKTLFDRFCKLLDLEGIIFDAVDENGIPIYHTNVMMALGAEVAVICLEAMPNPQERVRVQNLLEATGHTVVPITLAQMSAFAGNMLEVYNQQGSPFLIMSQRAYDSLDQPQIDMLGQFAELLVIPLDVIETYGGGSVRCMMAEIF